jgi:putative nucleotidyltransferase with HDIG domain
LGDARGLAKGEAAHSDEGQAAEVATRPWSNQGRPKSGFGGCDAPMDSSSVRTDGPPTISLQRVTFKSFWQVRAGWFRWGTVLRGTGEDWPVLLFAGLLTGAVALLSVALVLASPSVPWLTVLGLCALTFIGERQCVRLTGYVEISVSFLPLVFAAVLFGPLAAMIVGAAGMLSQFPLRRSPDVELPYLRWIVWTSTRALVGASAGFGALAAGGPQAHSYLLLLVATAAAASCEAVSDFALGVSTALVRRRASLLEVARTTGPVLLIAIPFYTAVIPALAYAFRAISPWTAAFVVIPALTAHRLLLLFKEQRQAIDELTELTAKLERANLSFAAALVATLDARDEYTAGHSTAVAVYARDIAAKMGLSEEEQELAHLCGLVHDIGKVGLPAGLLEKPGTLTLVELRQMQEHSAIGQRILANVETYATIAPIVRHHHERVDGMGYPDGLTREETPILARIIAVADAYNAMTSDRPYRRAMPPGIARSRLTKAIESQFDADVVVAFEGVLGSADSDYRRGVGDAFASPFKPPAATAGDLEADLLSGLAPRATATLRGLTGVSA